MKRWKLVICYEATEAEATDFGDRIMGSAEDVLAHPDRFAVATQFQAEDSRRRAVRWALAGLWAALRYGELS